MRDEQSGSHQQSGETRVEKGTSVKSPTNTASERWGVRDKEHPIQSPAFVAVRIAKVGSAKKAKGPRSAKRSRSGRASRR